MNIKKYLMVLPLIAGCNGLGKYHLGPETRGQSDQETGSRNANTENINIVVLKELNEHLENPNAEKFIEVLNKQSIDKVEIWLNKPYGNPRSPILFKAIVYYNLAEDSCNKEQKDELYKIICALLNKKTLDVNQTYCRQSAFDHFIDSNLYEPLELLINRTDFKMPKEDELVKIFRLYNLSDTKVRMIEYVLHKAEIIKERNDYFEVLRWAVKNNCINLTTHLLGSKPNNLLNASGQDLTTLLHLAAECGHLEIVKWLVDAGADINAKDNYNRTLLHLAAECGHLEIVKWLVDAGADINAKDNYNRTLLHLAAECGHLEIVKWLVDAGADINAKNNYNRTLLHLAAGDGHLEIVKWLVEKGFDVNAKDNCNRTPLDFAAGDGHLEIVKWLVDAGADINAKNNYNRTLLHLAARGAHLEIVKWLVEKGFDVNAKDNCNTTALHFAAECGHLEIVKWLVDAGADINAKDNCNTTALYFAAECGHLEIVKWLENRANVNKAMKNRSQFI